MTKEELYDILAIDKSYRIERTVSTSSIRDVQALLAENGNKLAVFDVNLLTVFMAKVKDAETLEADNVRQLLFDDMQPDLQPSYNPSCNHKQASFLKVDSSPCHRAGIRHHALPRQTK